MGNCCPEPQHRHPLSPPPAVRIPSPPFHPSITATTTKTNKPKASSKAGAEPNVLPAGEEEEEEARMVRLYGPETCALTWRLRLTLLYKGVSPQYVARESPIIPGPLLRFGNGINSDVISGSEHELLQCIDTKFPVEPNGVVNQLQPAEEVVLALELQHLSIQRHLEGIARAVKEMGVAGKKGRKMGAAAEGRRIGRWYGDWVEIMLDHARMEERLIFPALERAAYKGVCKMANEQHAKDLPMLNGIKEDIKSLNSFDFGSSIYQESLLNLCHRLKKLQEHVRDHFKEEETELLPLIDSIYKMDRIEGDVSNWSNSKWVAQLFSLTESTHSQMLPLFIAGLLPEEAMKYIDFLCRSVKDEQKLVNMIKSVVSLLEGTCQSSFIFDSLLVKK